MYIVSFIVFTSVVARQTNKQMLHCDVIKVWNSFYGKAFMASFSTYRINMFFECKITVDGNP